MVTVLMPGQSDETACVRISAALSEVTKQKLGFSVSIEQVAPTNYSAELWKRMVCQTMPDLFFLTVDQPLDVYLNQNCILPLSALLEEYPGLKALFSEQQWASRTYYRRIYAVPAQAVSMYQIGFLARADWMRELDARPEEITNLDALHDLLMQVRQRRPNAEGVLPDNGQVFPFPELDPLGDTFGVLTEESGTTVVNWYAADAYSRLCRTMHQWYQEGLILRNASLRDEPATDRMRLGNSFGFFARLNRDSLDCCTRACGTELTAIPLGPTIQNGSIPVESWCLPVTNSHRREALALLELLYTDASCYDLFAKGDGKEEQFHPWQNLYLNASGLLPETDEQPQWVSPAYGFSFNNSAVAAKLDACRALKNSYHNGLMCGYLDMVIPAFIIGTITGILFGIIAAKNRGKVIDSVISFFANIGVSMPMFWLGMMGMLVFALKLRVLPSSGYVPITRDFGGWLSHMIMPIIVLSLGVNAGFVRLTRSSMLEVMRQDYVTTARAKGVSKKDVTFRHQLRNSMIPIVTTMGMRLGSMVGSTVLIESLFVIPGLGSVMMNGISNRDFMLVANGVLIISIFVAICNLVVDILYGIIDPRTR